MAHAPAQACRVRRVSRPTPAHSCRLTGARSRPHETTSNSRRARLAAWVFLGSLPPPSRPMSANALDLARHTTRTERPTATYVNSVTSRR
jgi:hypothetical protein